MHHPPIIKHNILQLRVGSSLILEAETRKIVSVAVRINRSLEYKDLGSLPKGVQRAFQGDL